MIKRKDRPRIIKQNESLDRFNCHLLILQPIKGKNHPRLHIICIVFLFRLHQTKRLSIGLLESCTTVDNRSLQFSQYGGEFFDCPHTRLIDFITLANTQPSDCCSNENPSQQIKDLKCQRNKCIVHLL